MTSLPTPELSRPIKVKALPAEPVTVEADVAEREALASRFGLSAIDSLRAEIDLKMRGNGIRATGILNSAFHQACAISGEDFPVVIDEALDLRFVESETLALAGTEEEEIEVELDAEDCDDIEYSGDTFDLGEAVAQTLGLAIDPYPEGPAADEARKNAGITAEGEQDGPLADMLRGLKDS